MARKHKGTQATSGGHGAGRGRRKNTGGGITRSRWLWIGVGIAVVAAAVLLILRPKQTVGVNEVTAAQAYEKYQAGAFFLDVRSEAEWNQGHIAKSVLIPLDELPNRLNEVPRDRDIVVVCKSGVRSKEGAAVLVQAGYERVSCLSGGLNAWVEAGYTVEQ